MQGFITGCSAAACNATATLNHYTDHVSKLNCDVIVQPALDLASWVGCKLAAVIEKRLREQESVCIRYTVHLHGGSAGTGGD